MSPPRYPRLLPITLLAGCLWSPPVVCAEGNSPRVGRPHPQIVLPTIEGDRVIALSSLRGRKVLLVHFASW
jgi:hypothetical protein